MATKLFNPGDVWRGGFSTRNTSGAKTAADSLPTAVLCRNGTDDGAVTVTVTQIGSTNRYTFSLTIPSSYAAGDNLSVWASATVATVQDTVAVEQTRLVTFSDIVSTAAGTGARAVTVTVRDGAAQAIANARVRMGAGAQTYVAFTNSLGVASFSLDDAVWTRSATAAGYSFTPDTVTVDAAHTAFVVTMTMNVITPPALPGQSTGVLLTLDGQDNPKPGVPIVFKMIKQPGAAGLSHGGDAFTLTSDGAGNLSGPFTIGATYTGKRGNGPTITFVVKDLPDFLIDAQLGRDTDA
jgi:hypothetical protein